MFFYLLTIIPAMTTNINNIIQLFSGKKVLVIGDFILDVYHKGTSSRLSPEAPVPVVDVREKLQVPGGAANSAVNLRSLGADVTFLSVIGFDEDGKRAIQILENRGIHTGGILKDPARATLVKSRVMAGNHIITRFDTGTDTPIHGDVEARFVSMLEKVCNSFDAILISDYSKGVVTESIVATLKKIPGPRRTFISVDSRRLSFFRGLRPDFVKPNYEEVVGMLGMVSQAEGRREQILESGRAIFEQTGATVTAVTLDQEGALLFRKNKFEDAICAEPVPNPRVVGAGDTFISAYTLAAICGADSRTAGEIACGAAAIAVRKDGTAACSSHELAFHFKQSNKQINTMDELAHLCSLYREEGRRIVFTNGCFDILHSGHVSYLNRARKLGDVLIVGVNNDESIKRLKGMGRPINPLDDRVQVLAGLSSIDHIISFGKKSDDTPIELIRVVKPDVFVKGGDYTREKLPEADTVESAGGRIVFLALVADHSTTQIIQQIHGNSTLAVA